MTRESATIVYWIGVFSSVNLAATYRMHDESTSLAVATGLAFFALASYSEWKSRA